MASLEEMFQVVKAKNENRETPKEGNIRLEVKTAVPSPLTPLTELIFLLALHIAEYYCICTKY